MQTFSQRVAAKLGNESTKQATFVVRIMSASGTTTALSMRRCSSSTADSRGSKKILVKIKSMHKLVIMD